MHRQGIRGRRRLAKMVPTSFPVALKRPLLNQGGLARKGTTPENLQRLDNNARPSQTRTCTSRRDSRGWSLGAAWSPCPWPQLQVEKVPPEHLGVLLQDIMAHPSES